MFLLFFFHSANLQHWSVCFNHTNVSIIFLIRSQPLCEKLCVGFLCWTFKKKRPLQLSLGQIQTSYIYRSTTSRTPGVAKHEGSAELYIAQWSEGYIAKCSYSCGIIKDLSHTYQGLSYQAQRHGSVLNNKDTVSGVLLNEIIQK